MVIFHSYVSLPEGISHINPILASTQMVIQGAPHRGAECGQRIGGDQCDVAKKAMAIRHGHLAWVWILHI